MYNLFIYLFIFPIIVVLFSNGGKMEIYNSFDGLVTWTMVSQIDGPNEFLCRHHPPVHIHDEFFCVGRPQIISSGQSTSQPWRELLVSSSMVFVIEIYDRRHPLGRRSHEGAILRRSWPLLTDLELGALW